MIVFLAAAQQAAQTVQQVEVVNTGSTPWWVRYLLPGVLAAVAAVAGVRYGAKLSRDTLTELERLRGDREAELDRTRGDREDSLDARRAAREIELDRERARRERLAGLRIAVGATCRISAELDNVLQRIRACVFGEHPDAVMLEAPVIRDDDEHAVASWVDDSAWRAYQRAKSSSLAVARTEAMRRATASPDLFHALHQTELDSYRRADGDLIGAREAFDKAEGRFLAELGELSEEQRDYLMELEDEGFY